MKNVTYMGQVFEASCKAKFIAADRDGIVYTYGVPPHHCQDGDYLPVLSDEVSVPVGRLHVVGYFCEAI